jgi:hypothetical protein
LRDLNAQDCIVAMDRRSDRRDIGGDSHHVVRSRRGQPVRPAFAAAVDERSLYIHKRAGRRGRILDDATEQFVDSSRSGVDAG